MGAIRRQLLSAVLSVVLINPACGEPRTIASDPNNVNGAASYTYDAVGNRTQKTSTLPGYPGGLTNYNANDQLATDTYDANGNTAASQGVGYVYDFENHLVQAGSGISIVYDGDGNRVSKTVAGVTTTYLVDGQNPTGYAQVLYESTQNVTPSQTYIYGLELVGRQRTYYSSSVSQWIYEAIYYLYDGHGSVRALTDTTGTVTDTYDYDAFGNLLHTATFCPPSGIATSTGTACTVGSSPAPTPNNYLFAGEQFDPDLNLYYNRARYLNVSTGRFWNMDSFEGRDRSPLSLHKYLYAGVDPINRRDPSGLDFSLTAATVTTGIAVTLAGGLVGGYYARTVRGIVLGAGGGALVGLALANTDRRLAFRAISGGLLGAANQLFVNYLLENRASVLNQPPPSPQTAAENVLSAFDAGVVGGYAAYVTNDLLQINPYLAAAATSGINSGVNAILQGQSLCDFCAAWIASTVISSGLQVIGVGDTIGPGGALGFEADALKSLIRTGLGRTFGTTFRQIYKFLNDFGEPQAAKSFICD